MNKPDYILAQEAEDDLVDIALYTDARWGREQQRIYITGIYELFDRITTEPLLGPARPDLGMLTRMRRYQQSHTVYYDYEEGAPVAILRVLHVRQDAQAAFGEE